MKSREPVLVHGRDTWDKVNLPESLFDDRIAAIRAILEEQSLDVILVYGRGDSDGHLSYVSNLVNKVPNWGLLVAITPDGIRIRNERSSRTQPVIERGTWIRDFEFVSSVVTDIHDFIGITEGGRIGTVGLETLPHAQYQAFLDQVERDTIVQLDEAFWDFREAKHPKERDQIARAGRIMLDVHDFIQETELAPTTERHVTNQADRIARLRGIRDVRTLIGNHAQTEPHLRPAEEIPIEEGSPVSLYTAGRFEGYWAEYARTYRFGKDEIEVILPSKLENVYQEAIDSIVVGMSAEDVQASFETTLSAAGFDLSPAYSVGHGIGLDIAEPPTLTEGNSHTISDGMTLSVRAVVDSADHGLIVMNDTICVTANGVQLVTRT